MQQKSILITGCSSGIGYASAQELKKRGWRVFASCRKMEDCYQLKGQGFDSPLIDYSNPSSIASGMEEVLTATDGKLDALFNNGAYAIPGAVEDISTEALRAIFEVNFFGWHDLTHRAIPVMRAQGRGRIVQCSSVLGLATMPWRGAYNATKFALEGITDTLRIEMRDTPIHIVLIEPGPITSNFRLNSILQFENWIDWKASPRSAQYRDELRQRLYKNTQKTDLFELPAKAVVKKLIHALESPRPQPRYYVTTPTYLLGILRRILPTRALDAIMARG
ncbi:MAG TPA: short-chain dehydrogenase [Rhodobacteraceae bacterium]|nr:SDR family NAD(P)-dependent oxidoreductase [Alphaproteobacteria bacterium]MDG0981523.1 SDR family NAD(P)-dependent oxidoreductase [Tateyamaria sp.]HAB37309.1 short-chain dehydrogenase [Paracoccaceae bacterium]MCH9833930.1 SDR family NAD(P)-dependent oxidoreductase [Alphaproteobacteria bacterium]MDG1421931.1 SDR family NAD(P)-dependent oxidoreductase [Tateyamaria sp.]